MSTCNILLIVACCIGWTIVVITPVVWMMATRVKSKRNKKNKKDIETEFGKWKMRASVHAGPVQTELDIEREIKNK